MPVLCAFVLHVSAAAALHGSRRQRNGFFVSDWKGTVPDEFEGCAENASVVRLRSSRLSSGRVLRLPEAKELLLYALSIVPVAVLAKARLLPKAARDRRLAPDSSRLASSVCLSACIFAESFSPLSHKEKLCLH
ncbi:unnamed protein product [Coccothraustes coccothraustes]